MSDLETLVEMFGRAKPFENFQHLDFVRLSEAEQDIVAHGQQVYSLFTGPDDAVARLAFSAEGELLAVSVDEC